MACLCAPTSHEGSFRCRLHRVPNPISNPAHSSANHPFKVVNYCTHSYNVSSDQIACMIPNITVRESSSSTSMPPYPFDDHVRFSHSPQVASDPQNISRTRPSSSSLSDTLASSSSSSSSSPSPSPYWSSTSPKSPSYRLPSSSSSLYTPSSSSSSRASASSSSPSPSTSPFWCTRPPPAKRPSSTSPSKSPYRVSSSPAPTSSLCGAASASITTPSASHAAALAIMKQHSHNKHGARTHNRNILSPASASKIGPSRLSRMAVACADELPLLKEEHYISNSLQHGSAPDTLPGSFADTTAPSGFAPFKAAPVGLKTRSAVNKLKQSESSCRIVGSKGGSLIMPTVY